MSYDKYALISVLLKNTGTIFTTRNSAGMSLLLFSFSIYDYSTVFPFIFYIYAHESELPTYGDLILAVLGHQGCSEHRH